MSFLKNLLSWRWWLGIRPKAISLPPPQMGVTVIVPAHNEAASIGSTIESLLAQTYPLAAIIVVDDCSSDGTGDIARQYPGVTVLRTDVNQKTKSKALAWGLKIVETELFLVVDGDTALQSNAVYEAIRYFRDPACEVVSGTVVPQIRSTFWECGRLAEYLYAAAIMKPAQNHQGLVLVASGCFAIFRTATVRELGGFDERTVAEDLDITWEIQDRGGRVYFAVDAVCYPVDPSSWQIYFNQMDRWYRGFMQNLKVRNFNLFPHKRRMAFVAYGYMIWNIGSALFLPGLFWMLTGDPVATILYVLMMTAAFAWLPILVMAWKIGVFKDTIKGLVPFLVLPYINLLIYVRAFFLEIVFGLKLNEWKKGH